MKAFSSGAVVPDGLVDPALESKAHLRIISSWTDLQMDSMN
jgi:hypothetical protein